ncbi:MAG: DUF5777 family beta-barrel protein [Bacteroidales bacterium]
MNKKLFLTLGLFLGLLAATPVTGQDDEKPIRPPFETLTLIDNQTTVNPYKGAMTLELQHRFSQISTISDLFGIYGTANTRMALSYGVTDKLMVALGTTRQYKLQDLEWKYSIFTQTQSGKIPVSLSYAGNAVLDARAADAFGPAEEYKFIHRMSYMNQLIVSRKFGMLFSAQVAPTVIWMNAVEEGYKNLNFSANAGIRAQVLGFHSIILEYEQPFTQPETEDIYPNLALGVEIGTSTHSFRVFVANYNALVKNYNVLYNANNPFAGDYQFGFNISIKF